MKKFLQSVKPNITYNTYEFYKYITKDHLIPAFGKMELAKIKPIHVQEFYTKSLKKVSGTTTRHFHTLLNMAFNQAIKWQMIYINPCFYVTKPKNRKKKLNIWDKDQLNRFLNAIQDLTMYLPCIITAATGMREGEVCGLRWENVDLGKKIIYVKEQYQWSEDGLVLSDLKTPGSVRNISISSNLVTILEAEHDRQEGNKNYFKSAYDSRDFVVCQNDGKPYDPKYISRNFRRVLKEANHKKIEPDGTIKKVKLYELLDIPIIRFHDLRHTHASLLLKSGANPKVISEKLGHSTVKMTLDTYASVLPNMQKEAAEKVDNFFCPNLPTNCQQTGGANKKGKK